MIRLSALKYDEWDIAHIYGHTIELISRHPVSLVLYEGTGHHRTSQGMGKELARFKNEGEAIRTAKRWRIEALKAELQELEGG